MRVAEAVCEGREMNEMPSSISRSSIIEHGNDIASDCVKSSITSHHIHSCCSIPFSQSHGFHYICVWQLRITRIFLVYPLCRFAGVIGGWPYVPQHGHVLEVAREAKNG